MPTEKLVEALEDLRDTLDMRSGITLNGHTYFLYSGRICQYDEDLEIDEQAGRDFITDLIKEIKNEKESDASADSDRSVR